MKQFIEGFKYIFPAFKLILKPGIRLYTITPLLINTLLFASVIVYGANLLGDQIDKLIQQWQWLEWLSWLLWPVFVLISFTIVFFCFSIIANLIGAPFNAFLAESVEKIVTGQDNIEESRLSLLLEIRFSIKSEFQKLGYFIIRALPLLLLFAIPIVNIAAPVIWFLLSAWMLALEYVSYPMSNHGIIFNNQRKKLLEKRQLAFGFGVAVMLLTMLPLVNFIAMPVAVIGATKLYVEHIKTGRILPETMGLNDN